KLVGLIVPLRMTDRELEVGDELLHGEVAIDMEPPEPVMSLNGHLSPTPAEAGSRARPASSVSSSQIPETVEHLQGGLRVDERRGPDLDRAGTDGEEIPR